MKYKVFRSYTVCEMHVVEADDEDAAINLVEGDIEDYFVKSYDGDYDRDENHKIIYNVEEGTR